MMGASGFSVSCGRAEALAFFRTWRDDRALVRCELRLLSLAACFVARVTTVDADRVAFMSDDRTTELVLPLARDCEFRYGDIGRSHTLAHKYTHLLVYFPSHVGDPEQSDYIIFAERRSPADAR